MITTYCPDLPVLYLFAAVVADLFVKHKRPYDLAEGTALSVFCGRKWTSSATFKSMFQGCA